MKFPIYFTLNSKWGWMRSAVQNTVKGCSLPDTYHSCFAVFLWMTWACTSYAERQKGYSAQQANQDTWQCSVQPLHWITWELGFKNQLLKIENFESKSWILRFYIDLFYHWGKELGKCTHHWMTNDEKNTNECFRHLVSLASKRRKTDNNKKKQRMGQRNFKNEYFDPISLPPSPLSFASFCCCMSFFFYLTKTLSVKSARSYFSHHLSFIGEYSFQALFLTCLLHQQLLAFSSTTIEKKKVLRRLVPHIFVPSSAVAFFFFPG